MLGRRFAFVFRESGAKSALHRPNYAKFSVLLGVATVRTHAGAARKQFNNSANTMD